MQLGNILRKENTDQAIKIHQSLTVRPNLSSDQRVQIHKALAKDYIEIGYTKNAIEEAKKILLIEKRNLWSIKFLIKTSEENLDWEQAAIWSKSLQKISGKKCAQLLILRMTFARFPKLGFLRICAWIF